MGTRADPRTYCANAPATTVNTDLKRSIQK